MIAVASNHPDERRLRNVIEEMAIAVGVPVPEIYLLDNANGLIQERQAELLRAVAETLDCPIPPFVICWNDVQKMTRKQRRLQWQCS